MHDVELGIAFWTSTRGMDMMAAEMRTEFKRIFSGDVGEVLVTECHNFALGNE
jgi:hypothetical protein